MGLLGMGQSSRLEQGLFLGKTEVGNQLTACSPNPHVYEPGAGLQLCC